jgi:hypothetical protein
MQIQLIPVRKAKSGFALVITLMFLAVSLVIFTSIMYLVSSSATVTARNNLFNASRSAAEGATEMAVAQMNRDFLYQSINVNDVSSYQCAVSNLDQTDWPVKYQFSDTNGVVNQISVSIWPQVWTTNLQQLNSSQFKNLYGYVANCDLTATATPLNQSYQTPSTVMESLQMCAIPIFQFGVFYNMDLDLSNGKPMTMNGKTFVNGNIWMYPQNTMTFNDSVCATLLVTNDDNPNDQQNLTSCTAPTYNFTANGGKALSMATAVTMPLNGTNSNPTNVEAILNLPPVGLGAPNSAAYQDSNQMYLYNVCDLIISNAATGINTGTSTAANTNNVGTNFVIYFQDKDGASFLTKLTNEVFTFSNKTTKVVYTTNSPNAWNTTNYVRIAAGFPWVTNVTFYDYREGDNVKTVQIDVSLLNIWLTNQAYQGYRWNSQCSDHKGHWIDSIYVYNSVPPAGGSPGQLPGVRVVNGTNLPSRWGLTFATPFPLYTLGDYNTQTNFGPAGAQRSLLMTNTAWTWPSALMGDSVTILSSAWHDSTTTENPTAGNTTVNAACLEGIVPSTYVSGGTYAGKHYSGGLENFLRLLENWTGYTLCYNGSIVVMFPSIYGTNFWQQPGAYYNPPTRQWGFDANFKVQGGQPPATPRIKAMIRSQWIAK